MPDGRDQPQDGDTLAIRAHHPEHGRGSGAVSAGAHLDPEQAAASSVVTATADERILADPAATTASTAWLVLGGTALFLAGHAAFKFTVWGAVPWTRLAAIVMLPHLGAVATSLPALALGGATAAVVVLLAASDRLISGNARTPRQVDVTASATNRVGEP